VVYASVAVVAAVAGVAVGTAVGVAVGAAADDVVEYDHTPLSAASAAAVSASRHFCQPSAGSRVYPSGSGCLRRP